METKDTVVIVASSLTLAGVVFNSIVTLINGKKSITIETKDQEISRLRGKNEDLSAELSKKDKSRQVIARNLLLQIEKEKLYILALKDKHKILSTKNPKTIKSEITKAAKEGADKNLLQKVRPYPMQRLRELL